MKNQIQIGLLGLGTVGRGVYQLLSRDNAAISDRLGARLVIKRILVKDPSKERGIDIPPGLLTTDPAEILADKEIDLVAEVIGGTKETKQLVMACLGAGKSVVTANKELLADYGQEVLSAAEAKKVDVFFEASVGGGIPIIHPLRDCLIGSRIQKVMGIVNGTTNFILTKMGGGQDFSEALAEAQALGFAERDPSNDVEGHDAASKIAILASIAFNSRVKGSQVFTEGITKISPQDIMYAAELGYTIKLIALAKTEGSGLDVRVHPAMIPIEHPLAAVRGAYNAIFIEGDAVGELMFFGQGAGSLPTASAVVADLFLAARNVQNGLRGDHTCTCFNALEVKAIDDITSRYYLLIECADQPGVLAQIARVFGDNQVSLGSVIQKSKQAGMAEVVFMTHAVARGNLLTALSNIQALDCVSSLKNVIWVEGDYS